MMQTLHAYINTYANVIYRAVNKMLCAVKWRSYYSDLAHLIWVK